MATEIIASGVVSSGGSLFSKNVEIYGSALNFIFDYCSSVTVMNGGRASGTTLGNSSYMKILSGGIVNDTTVKSATMIVSQGGLVDYVTFTGQYAGTVRVEGSATNISGNGSLTIASGGKTSGTQINNVVYVSDGGRAIDTTMDLSGNMVVYSGGQASDTKLLESAHISLSGTALSTYLQDEKTSMFVHGGATASVTHISAGEVFVSEGGTVSEAFVSGGTLHVLSGGTANTVKTYGGTVNVSNGASLSAAVAQDGKIRVYSGGTAVTNRATKTGRIVANAGGALVSCLAMSSGRVELEGGGALATEVALGGMMLVEGAAHPIVGKDPTLSNGIASNTRIHLGAVASIGSGGAMLDTIVGYSSATLNPKPGTGLDLPSILLQYAGLYVNSSGLANGVTASKGAIVAVGNNGMLISARVSSGASATVMQGGSANTLNILRGGSASIAGSASKLNIAGEAKAEIKNGGSASGVTVSSSGVLRANVGALLSGVTVNAGGIVTGIFAGLENQAVTLADGILDFDISALGSDTVCVEQLNTAFAGTYFCTLTVGDTQANGTYKLAADAAGFDKTISVQNTAGENLGALIVGATQKIGGLDYTLNLDGENLLSVTVGAVVPEPVVVPPYLTGDFNGDLFDTLAVQKDSTVTIYQNGEAWGLGLTLDPGWSVVGTGDFNADGLDDFLRVNDEGYVVGELSNGNGTFSPQVLNLKNAGWSILGTGDFNGNGSDDVLIANPTGASETVGLLGYWESGVTWTLINGYSPEWECVSTGDFNGDGKCDMLWKNSFIGAGDLVYNAYCTWIVEDPVDWRMVSVANPDEWNFLCSGDFDGNGSHDIAMINDVGVVGIWGVTDGYLSSWSILSAVTSEWQLAGVADFNADGTDDIAWCNTETGLAGYWQINDKQLTTWTNIATIS